MPCRSGEKTDLINRLKIFIFLRQVAICAGADSVHAYAAIIIGIVAGLSHRSWTKVILKWKIDDPVESVSGREH